MSSAKKLVPAFDAPPMMPSEAAGKRPSTSQAIAVVVVARRAAGTVRKGVTGSCVLQVEDGVLDVLDLDVAAAGARGGDQRAKSQIVDDALTPLECSNTSSTAAPRDEHRARPDNAQPALEVLGGLLVSERSQRRTVGEPLPQ